MKDRLVQEQLKTFDVLFQEFTSTYREFLETNPEHRWHHILTGNNEVPVGGLFECPNGIVLYFTCPEAQSDDDSHDD